MKKSLYALLCSALIGLSAHAAEPPLVALTQIVEHPSLDAIRKGIVDELQQQGYNDGKNVRYEYESAQGNGAIALQIAQKFAGENPAVVVAIATPSAQAAASALHGATPLVFASVTDPVAAKLVDKNGHALPNSTGTSDAIPIAKQIEIIQQIMPHLKTLGTIYNSGDANSAATIEKLQRYLKSQNIALVTSAATKSSEVNDAINSLVGKVDAVYIGLDNTVVSALEAVIKAGQQNKLPIFSADTDSVKRGTIAALGFDYYDVGRLTGKQVAKILAGSAPNTIPVATISDNLHLVVNPAAAKKMGLQLPAAILKQATTVIGASQ